MGERDPRGKPATTHRRGEVERGTAAPLESAASREPSEPASAPSLARTATLDDPLTTSLLAEVARRSRTIEVSPEQIDEALDAAGAEVPAPADDPRQRTRR